MPFIPHTDDDVRAMLAAIGVDSHRGAVRRDSAAAARRCSWPSVPARLNEIGDHAAHACARRAGRHAVATSSAPAPTSIIFRLRSGRSPRAASSIPPYTPYQAEASQGTLQVLYEYQTHDGLADRTGCHQREPLRRRFRAGEAVLMAVRAAQVARRVLLLPRTVHPAYRKVVRTHRAQPGHRADRARLTTARRGCIAPESLQRSSTRASVAALVDSAAQLLRRAGTGATSSPTGRTRSGALVDRAWSIRWRSRCLRRPAQWGSSGADIAVGEGQPLGVPLAARRPVLRLHGVQARSSCGRCRAASSAAPSTSAGKPGFTLTLQAREQHIRRSKATPTSAPTRDSLVTAATIYMALLGPAGPAARRAGLPRELCSCCSSELERAEPASAPFRRSRVSRGGAARCASPRQDVLRALRAQGILGGLDLAAATIRSSAMRCWSA